MCGDFYLKGKQWVLDISGFPVNGVWSESDRAAYCGVCRLSGPMRETVRLKVECVPFRYPPCGGIIANRKGEE